MREINGIKTLHVCSALQKFGYGEKFMHMIKVAVTKIHSKIKINGLPSDTFTLSSFPRVVNFIDKNH